MQLDYSVPAIDLSFKFKGCHSNFEVNIIFFKI